MSVSTRLLYLDVLRVLATLAVIMIHVCVVLVVSYAQIDQTAWWTGNLFDSFSRWSVPVFVMISGAVLLHDQQPKTAVSHQEISAFYAKRLLRLAVPLLMWTVFYAYYHHLFRGDPLSLEYIWRRIIFDQPYEHLYFIWLLLELALITPWLRLLANQVSQSSLGFLAVLLTGLMFFWTPSRLLFPFFIPYLGYYSMGLFLRRVRLTRARFWLAGLCFIGSSTLIASGTSLAFAGQLRLLHPLVLYEYAHPLVAVGSMSLFVSVRAICDTEAVKKWLVRWQQPLRFFSSLTFGIYLIHIAVLEILINGAGLNLLTIRPAFLGVALLLVLTVTLSAALSYGVNVLGTRVGPLFRTKQQLDQPPT